MSHTQTKLSISFRHLIITSSIVFLSVASVLLFSAFKTEPSTNISKQVNSLKHSSPLKGTLNINLLGDGNISGNGVGTHLGRFEYIAHDDESGFPFLTGTVTMTAANGDQIYATHSGTVEFLADPLIRVPLQHTITGGTGRFANATGDFMIVTIANLNTNTATGVMDGNISY